MNSQVVEKLELLRGFRRVVDERGLCGGSGPTG